MAQVPPMDRGHVEVTNLAHQGGDDFVAAPAADCLSMVWPLTIDAWAFKDPEVVESRLQRHVVRVVRREC